MGISHPYLAILSAIAFIGVLVGMTFTYLYIVNQAIRAPVLGVHAEAFIHEEELVVVITMRHVHGREVTLNSVKVYGEGGRELLVIVHNGSCYIVNEPSALCYLTGIREARILPGSTGYLRVIFPAVNNYFYEGKTYQGAVFFSEGTYPIAFTPLRLIRPMPPPIHPVLPVSFTPPLHDISCVFLSKTERRSLGYTNYTDFDRYTAGWVIANYREGLLSASVVEGYSGRGVLLNESGVGFSVYYLDLNLRDNVTLVFSSRFRFVNGTKYYGLVYVLSPAGLRPPHPADRGIAVLINVSSSGVSLDVVDLGRLYDPRYDGVVSTVRVVDRFNLTRWHVLSTNFTLTTTHVIVNAVLYDEFYNKVATLNGSVSIIGVGLPSRYMGVILNDTAVVVDDILVTWTALRPVVLGGLPLGELYSVLLLDSKDVLVAANSSRAGYVELYIDTVLGNWSKVEVYYPSGLRCLAYLEWDSIIPGDVFNLTCRRINYTLGRFNASATVFTAVSARNNTSTEFVAVGIVNYDTVNYTITLNLAVDGVIIGEAQLGLYNQLTRVWSTLNSTAICGNRVLLLATLPSNSTVFVYLRVYIMGERATLHGIVEVCAIEVEMRTYCIVLPLRINMTQ